MAYSSTFSSFPQPTATSRLNNPSHSALHNSTSSAVGQLEAVMGLAGSGSVLGTIIGDLRSPDSGGGGHVQKANKGGTGQTTFAKGDILIASSSSVLTKLAVGTDNQVLTANSSVATGVSWGFPTNNVQSFISNGVWVKPSAASPGSRVFVQLWGGGGGGAWSSVATSAGGGGGGFYSEGSFPASILASSVLVGVGAGGLGSAQTGTNRGTAGGVTVFNTQTSLISAFGGGGGGANSTSGGGTAAGGGGGGGAWDFGGDGGNGTNVGGGGGTNGWVGASSILSSGGGTGGNSATNALYAAGGGGGSGNGGNAVYGGAGGGGAVNGALGSGGVSMQGGNGRAASIMSSGSVVSASIPGGGGGAVYGNSNASGGAGGSGKVIVTTFL